MCTRVLSRTLGGGGGGRFCLEALTPTSGSKLMRDGSLYVTYKHKNVFWGEVLAIG